MKIPTSTMNKGILRNADEGCSERTVSTGRSTSSVSFHNITVRGYDRTIGDNPSCSSGCPISIDWEYSCEVTVPFDTYEKLRPPSRNKSQMQIPPSARVGILQDWDFSLSTIMKTAREVEKDRVLRMKTAHSVVRREMIVNAIRGILTLPMFLCDRNKVAVYDENYFHDLAPEYNRNCNKHNPPTKEVKVKEEHTNDTSETKSNSDLSLSDHELEGASCSFSVSEPVKAGYDDDISVSSLEDDNNFADGLSITYHRHIDLEL